MSNTDKFTKVGNPGTATTLASPGHTIGGTTFNVGSTANWPTTTGVVFAVDTYTLQTVAGQQVAVRTPNSYTEWIGDVTNGTTISGAVIKFGTDQNYPAGSTTRVYIPVSSTRENLLIDGMLTSLDQDGTLKAGAVDNAAALASNVVTTAKIADGSITNPKLNFSGIATGFVAAGENTSSTSWVDLATTIDTTTVTINPSGVALVLYEAVVYQSSSGAFCNISFAASGANTIAAGTYAAVDKQAALGEKTVCKFEWLSGLTAGSTTFKMKYQVSSGTGNFSTRRIVVLPL